MRRRDSRWSAYIRAAVEGPGTRPRADVDGAGGRNHTGPLEAVPRRAGPIHLVRQWLAGSDQATAHRHGLLRGSLPLAAAATASWLAAAVGLLAPPTTVIVLACACAAVTLLLSVFKVTRYKSGGTILLVLLCMVGVLGSVGIRLVSSAATPLHTRLAAGETVSILLEVRARPRPVNGGMGPPRVSFAADILSASSDGTVTTGRVPVRIVAGTQWAGISSGDTAETAGYLVPGGPGEAGAGVFRPATPPLEPKQSGAGAAQLVTQIRKAWLEAVQTVWAEQSQGVAGLLPGMIMGHRDGIPETLSADMKTSGLTHLTAVSGVTVKLGGGSYRTVAHHVALALRASTPVPGHQGSDGPSRATEDQQHPANNPHPVHSGQAIHVRRSRNRSA